MDKIVVFFQFYSFLVFGNLMNKIKKYADFSRKSGKLAIQIKDDYYMNWKNVQIGKM